jgi:TetR/AcrR family transcriptional regulator, regulator of autoinduction and epiphytic fitness
MTASSRQPARPSARSAPRPAARLSARSEPAHGHGAGALHKAPSQRQHPVPPNPPLATDRVAAVVALRPSLKAQQLQLREDAIIDAVHALLADKGYDLMTVDEVAAAVGIAKTSLYKHFASKEALAGAAMARLLDRTAATIAAQPPAAPPIERLKAVVRWAIDLHLRRQMPLLPPTRSTLRETLARNRDYVDRLIGVSESLGNWIEQAQGDGSLNANLPAEVILYTLFARACDPVLDVLQLTGRFDDAKIADLVLSTCFDGLS